MSAQALATALGPPLMLHSSGGPGEAEIDHAQPIAVLKYLLQIWPQPATAGNVSGNVVRLLQCYILLLLISPAQHTHTLGTAQNTLRAQKYTHTKKVEIKRSQLISIQNLN